MDILELFGTNCSLILSISLLVFDTGHENKCERFAIFLKHILNLYQLKCQGFWSLNRCASQSHIDCTVPPNPCGLDEEVSAGHDSMRT